MEDKIMLGPDTKHGGSVHGQANTVVSAYC